MSRIGMEQRQRQLVDATLHVIAREGVAGASLRAIASAAGTPLASVHYAFASRAALLQAALESVIERSKTSAVSRFDTAGMDAEDILRTHMEIYVDRIRASRDEELGILELTLASLRDPSLDSVPGNLYAAYYEAAEQVVHALADDVGRPWAPPHRAVARFLVLLSDGVTLAYLTTGDESVVRDLIHTGATALASLLQPEETA